MLTKEQQIFFRTELLSNLDVEKLDEIQNERNKLIEELTQSLYPHSQRQKSIIKSPIIEQLSFFS